MKISILSLFPNFFNDFLKTSIIKRAIEKKIIEIDVVDFRNFSNDKHKKVDSPPYGGGPGMILQIQPIVSCLNSIKTENSKIILLTPSGSLYNQNIACDLSQHKHLILICGHYEGFDERILNYVDYQISIGDYILTSGETASLVLVESIIRLVPGVINSCSLKDESFNNDFLLDYPNYTKPKVFDNHSIPEVLISGNHKEIEKFRNQCRIEKTKKYRNDLYEKYLSLTKK